MKNFAKPLLVVMLVMLVSSVLAAQSGTTGYFIAINGQQTGPYDLVAMKDMIQKGTLTRTSLVWKEGMANWVEAATVQEVSALFTGAPPPLPSAQAPVVPPPISPQAVPANTVYKVGDRGPAGGFICYDKGFYSDGWRYLEVAPEDFPGKKQFAPNRASLYGSTPAEVGTGKANTIRIARAIVQEGKSGYPAQLCTGATFGGYNDWFLPSAMELKLVFQNLKVKGIGGFNSGAYWSSTYRSASNIRLIGGNGSEDGIIHSGELNVRAIRMF